MSTVPQLVTFGLALLGSVLGVVNTWQSLSRDRIRLKVVPKNFITSHGESGLCIEVTNLSFLPVTISQIGCCIRRPRGHYLAFQPRFMSGESLPWRMEPRTSITGYVPAGTIQDIKFSEVTGAFAKTACGRVRRGNSPVLRRHVKNLRAALKRAQ